ncbi:unnamed protein product [Rotaria sordida]|uniref:Uncharacterized protein n=1 Tax=Rotaria sordida TaxID=392033 RepID=A0A818M023_9BILA|nr:unnamed protein product [Rotaria sordida]CAF3580288.1 unnamed protein product [Rotaria sordida]
MSSSMELNSKIKELIDAKQYKEALDVVDSKFELCIDYTISIAINACSIINDYNRGLNIQQKLPSNSLKNSYVQASLI